MKELKRYLDSRKGNFSFYFEDLKDGYIYGFNDLVKMPCAGCIKLPVAMALFKEIENNKFSLDTNIRIGKDDIEEGVSGIIHEFKEKEYTLLELLIAMLIQSDNTAANKIIDLITKERINEIFLDMGLNNTKLVRKTSDKLSTNDKGENYSTSFELSKCYKILYESSYLNKEHSERILKILRRQQRRNKIPFYISKKEWCNIANKAGRLDGIEADSALLTVSKGDFIFTVMSSELPNNVYGITTIARISKMMWDIVNMNWK